MSENFKFKDEATYLSEVFAMLWAQKLMIALITCLSIFLAGYYILTAEKIFTAQALFKLEEKNKTSGFNVPGELGVLASLADFASGSNLSSSKTLLERVSAREFILEMKKKYSLDRDPFFNTYDPNYKDPLWKSTIKKIIGWQKTEQEENAIIDYFVIKSYKENVKFDETDGGAISITLKHADPNKASEYTNAIMEDIRRLVQNESEEAQSRRLDYLSQTLADSLQEMETAQENLKNYALQNSALAQENFISDSLKLDEIRMEKRKVTEIADLLSIIDSFIKSGNVNNSSYDALRSTHPLVDDIDFRRILGMSETISAWTWPEINTITAVSATLRDRIKRLDVDIQKIEENAKIYATSAEDLAKLTRDAKIAEATYTVLIEQVKSQALVAGFQPDTFKVFEYAVPPLAPSFPRRNILLALGVVVGIFIGCALALINSMLRGVFYTKSILITQTNAAVTLKSKPITRLAQKPIS